MGENGERTTYPTWKWLLGIAILVIAFFFSKGFDTFTAKGIARDTNYDKLQLSQQAVSERVTRLESSYAYIVEGIKELKTGQKELVDAFARHEQKGR